MTCNNHNARRKNSVVRSLRALPRMPSARFAAPSALALDSAVGLGLDPGLGANEPATDNGSSTLPATDTGNTGTVDVGGLLDGLLRRPGRR